MANGDSFRRGFASTFQPSVQIGAKGAQTAIALKIKKQAEKTKKEQEKLQSQTTFETFRNLVQDESIKDNLSDIDIDKVDAATLNTLSKTIGNQIVKGDTRKFNELKDLIGIQSNLKNIGTPDAARQFTAVGERIKQLTTGGQLAPTGQPTPTDQPLAKQPSIVQQAVTAKAKSGSKTLTRDITQSTLTTDTSKTSDHSKAEDKLLNFQRELDTFGNQTAKSKLQEENLKGELKNELDLKKKKEADIVSAEKGSLGTFRFLQQFGRSFEELKKFDPDIDKAGFGGFLIRKKGQIAEAFDELPETSALKIRILPMANAMAREIEGGRVTDSDRQIYADSFANALNEPSITNIRLASSSLIDLIDKGGNERGAVTKQLKMLAENGTDIFTSIVAQVVIEFPDMASEIFGEDFEVVE